MTYCYGLLRPSRVVGAAGANAGLLGAATLGIEVSEPALARACGLGNIDPQHGPCDGTIPESAIALALRWPLPPIGARFVTLRPDLDALGAMAVLAMRRREGTLGEETTARLGLIDAADRFDRGLWPGTRELPTTEEQALGVLGANPALATLSFHCCDSIAPLVERVALMKQWLLDGSLPGGAYANYAQRRASDFVDALGRRPGPLPWLLISSNSDSWLSVVQGTARDALAAGYCHAPTVVARNPAYLPPHGGVPHVKYTVAQWSPGHIDFPRLRMLLAGREPGWGGSRTILGSPQGFASRLPLNIVVALVRACLITR